MQEYIQASYRRIIIIFILVCLKFLVCVSHFHLLDFFKISLIHQNGLLTQMWQTNGLV